LGDILSKKEAIWVKTANVKTNQLFKFAIAAFALFDVILIVPYGAANTLATWTDTTGNDAWETAANWDIIQVPNNNTYDVRNSTSAPCNLSSQFQIGALTLSTNTSNLNLVPASLLAIDSSNGINNSGTIVVNTNAANSATTLRFDTSASISGSGSIQLNGINSGNAMISGDGVTVTNDANHMIHGRGDISTTANNAALVNNGIINADVSGDTMRIFLSNASGNKNSGIMKATKGGILYFDQGILDQSSGGEILAATTSGFPPAIVSLGDLSNGHSPTFLGGTFNTINTVIQANSVFFDGCTNQGDMQIPGGGLLAILGNGLVNNGLIVVNYLATNSTTTLRFDASAAITGAGAIELDGDNPGNAIISVNGVTVTNGANHYIGGRGDLSFAANNAVLVNNGTIVAGGGAVGEGFIAGNLRVFLSNSAGNQNNGVMGASAEEGPCVFSFQQGTINQIGGGSLVASAASSNATTQIGGPQTVTVIGGTLNTSSGNVLSTAVIQGIAAVLGGDMTNSGTYEIPANDFTHVSATSLTNDGTMTLDASSSLLRFDASTSIAGSGAIVLTNNAKMEINHNAINYVINGSNHTIKGNGTIQIDPGSTLTNNGIIAPGNSAGKLNLSGNLQLGSTSNLSFEIGGTGQGTDYDLLNKTDGGALALNGYLTVHLINNFTPQASDTFTILATQTALAGAFRNVASGTRLNTADNSGSFVVTYNASNVVLSNFGAPLPTPPDLLNISTRLRVLTGDNVGIAGFIITGTDAKRVIVRGIGPSLTDQGVPDALNDPTLELHDSSGATLAFNDNWRDTQQDEIIATGIPPNNGRESAIIATLSANNSSYTAILRGKNDTTGVGLVEVYDLDQSTNSKLANISTRGFVDTGNNVMIGGFILGGGNGPNATVVVRAIGPSLANSGVADALQDPTLELHDVNGALIAFDDNWKDSQQADIQATGIPPTDDRESAIVATLSPGNYTAIVRGVNDTTGVALVEVYNLQ
jgi:hypothetical protein